MVDGTYPVKFDLSHYSYENDVTRLILQCSGIKHEIPLIGIIPDIHRNDSGGVCYKGKFYQGTFYENNGRTGYFRGWLNSVFVKSGRNSIDRESYEYWK
jgi:hypothetical protein